MTLFIPAHPVAGHRVHTSIRRIFRPRTIHHPVLVIPMETRNPARRALAATSVAKLSLGTLMDPYFRKA